jgi:hypothetical protein
LLDEIIDPILPMRNDLVDFDGRNLVEMRLPVSSDSNKFISSIIGSVMDSQGGITNLTMDLYVGPNELAKTNQAQYIS